MRNHSRRAGHFIERVSNLSYQAMFLLWGLNIVVSAIFYAALSYLPGQGATGIMGDAADRIFDALYFSVITSTNTGIGDILPLGLSRFLVSVESILGLFLFAVFIAKLMSHRQGIALREVHRISFEHTFHNIREDMYVARKDFDRMVRIAHETHALPEPELEQLSVAYEQITNLIHEIPHFYDSEHGLYVIDERREDLLLEAVHRTIGRINSLLEVLSAEHVRWAEHETSVAKLRELVEIAHTLFNEWRHRSPYHKTTEFEKLMSIVDSLKARLAAELPLNT
jgi:hypothetical protein